MGTNNVSGEKQCFFKTCRIPYTTSIEFRDQFIQVCPEHALRYGTSYEKKLASKK